MTPVKGSMNLQGGHNSQVENTDLDAGSEYSLY